jgi:hypothetical protein
MGSQDGAWISRDGLLTRETQARAGELYREYTRKAKEGYDQAREAQVRAVAADERLQRLAIPTNRFAAELHRRKLEDSSRDLHSYALRLGAAHCALEGADACDERRKKATADAETEFGERLCSLPSLFEWMSPETRENNSVIRRVVQLPDGRVVLFACLSATSQLSWVTDSVQQFNADELQAAVKAEDDWKKSPSSPASVVP